MHNPRRSFAQYSFTRSFIILGIIILSYGIIHQLHLSFDITASRRYTLSDESQYFLSNLTEPLYLYYLEPSSMLNRPGIVHVHQLLQQIARSNPLIHYENFAINERPLLVSQFADYEQRLESGSLLVKMGNKKRVIESYRLLEYYIGNSGAPILMANQTEKVFMETLEQFFHTHSYTILAVNNHGELGLSNLMSAQRLSFLQLLESKGYTIITGDMLTTDLEEVDTLLFLAPTSDVSPQELAILDEWLEAGKHIYLSLHFQGFLPYNWQVFLEKWGITIQNQSLIEQDSASILAIDTEGFSFLGSLLPHEITDALTAQNMRPVFRLPLSISLQAAPQQRIKQAIIAQSSKRTKFLRIYQENVETLANPSAQESPLALAVEYQYDTMNPGRLYFSTGDVAYLNYNYANELLFAQAIDWLHQQISAIHIQPKNLYLAPMHSIRANQAILLAILITLIIPGTLILSAIGVYLSRKRG